MTVSGNMILKMEPNDLRLNNNLKIINEKLKETTD